MQAPGSSWGSRSGETERSHTKYLGCSHEILTLHAAFADVLGDP